MGRRGGQGERRIMKAREVEEKRSFPDHEIQSTVTDVVNESISNSQTPTPTFILIFRRGRK